MNHTRFRVIALTVAIAAIAVPAGAEPPTVRIPRVATPPRLEDFLNGNERRQEAKVTGFRQNRPGDGDPASQETTAYLSYDDRHLYIVFVCNDREPGKIRARLTRREAIFSDDFVGIALDTFRDRRRGYVFLANPLGIQADGITTEGRGDDFSFDALWYSRGQLTSDGYVVWMAIPFKSLRFRDAPEQTWGFTVARIIPRTNEQVFWPYITDRLQGLMQQLATLTGLERISPGRNMQIIPYGAYAAARFLDEGSGAHVTDHDPRAGVDAKMVLRDAFTVDLALNPDFSQVESDEPQVTINQRFEVFFPEKRPLFMENAGFFQTPIELFFSRRIADPQVAARVTGKAAGWAIGVLAGNDRAPGRQVAAGDEAFGERAAVGVVRAQREFAQQSAVGAFVTSRDFGGSSNRVVAADVQLRLSPNWTFAGQAAASATRESGGERLSGPAYEATLEGGGRHLFYRLSYIDRSPDFRAELGFVPRVDMRRVDQFLGYRWRPSGRRVLSFGPRVFSLVNWDYRGRRQDWSVEPAWGMEWTGQTNLDVGHLEAFELFEGIEFRKHRTRVFFRTEWLKWLAFSSSVARGTDINFFPAAGQVPFLGDSTTTRVSVTLRPTSRLNYDQTYLYTRLTRRPGTLPAGATPHRPIFSNHILRSRVNYQFTRELSLRAIVDYNGVERDPGLVALDPSKRITADLLFTYLLNPWTAIHVGYTDTYENFLLGESGILGRGASPTTPTGRQVFVKTSYLLRF